MDYVGCFGDPLDVEISRVGLAGEVGVHGDA